MSDADRLISEAKRLGEETYKDVKKDVTNFAERWWWAIAAGALAIGFLGGVIL